MQNIERFLSAGNSAFKDGGDDPKYTHRHARYLAEFMRLADKFYKTKKGNEQIPYHLVRRMILDDLKSNKRENIGLLALWIGTAEWGVSDVPTDCKDPASSIDEYSWKGPNASNGKRSREYEQGGVGIADYDVGKLGDFYRQFVLNNPVAPDIGSDAEQKLLQKNGKDATAYDTIKGYHAFYEIMSALFDRGDGSKDGDEWNDEASIWIMEDWLDSTWHKSLDVMKDEGKAAMYSRMKNSAPVVTEGKKSFKCDSGTMDFKKINSTWKEDRMEKQYGEYGVCKHKNGHSDDYARNNYINRLQYSKRVEALKKFVLKEKEKGFSVSEDGAYVLNAKGDVID